jgi:hypothetical protein
MHPPPSEPPCTLKKIPYFLNDVSTKEILCLSVYSLKAKNNQQLHILQNQKEKPEISQNTFAPLAVKG